MENNNMTGENTTKYFIKINLDESVDYDKGYVAVLYERITGMAKITKEVYRTIPYRTPVAAVNDCWEKYTYSFATFDIEWMKD